MQGERIKKKLERQVFIETSPISPKQWAILEAPMPMAHIRDSRALVTLITERQLTEPELRLVLSTHQGIEYIYILEFYFKLVRKSVITLPL